MTKRDLLLAPASFVYAILLVVPLLFLVRTSLLPPGPGAPLEGPASLESYAALADGYTLAILARTLRIAAATTVLCLLLGYPIAISIVRSTGPWRNLQTLMVLSPLFVSVVVRAYGWYLLLGRQGLVNRALLALGVVSGPLDLLYTELAVVIGLTEALVPFMALSLVAVLERIPRELTLAARGLGSSPLGAFLHVTLPLSLPGASSGALLVFMVSMGSYATPALLGGSRIRVMVTEIYAQVTAVFNWPLAASLSLLLLAVSLSLVALAERATATRREGPAR